MIVTTSDAFDDLQSMGPVDFPVVEYPEGQITGEPYTLPREPDRHRDYLHPRHRLPDQGQGRVGPSGLLADLPEYAQIDMGIFEGASSGMLRDSDINDVGNLLQDGSLAVVVVFENLWAAPFAAALRRSGAQLVAHGRIPVRALLDALDTAESGPGGRGPTRGGDRPGDTRPAARSRAPRWPRPRRSPCPTGSPACTVDPGPSATWPGRSARIGTRRHLQRTAAGRGQPARATGQAADRRTVDGGRVRGEGEPPVDVQHGVLGAPRPGRDAGLGPAEHAGLARSQTLKRNSTTSPSAIT